MEWFINMKVKPSNKIINSNFLGSCKSLSKNTKLPFSVFSLIYHLTLHHLFLRWKGHFYHDW